MGKKYTADTFEGAVTGDVTGSASLNVLKAGDTMTGTLTNTASNTTTRINNTNAQTGAGMLSFQADSGSGSSIVDKFVFSRGGSGGQQAAIKFEEGSGTYADNFIKFELSEPNTYTSTEYLTLQHSSATSSNRYIKASQPVIAQEGIYLGTTTKSSVNHLDDYEEGTWTPGLGTSSGHALTYVTQSGKYVKVGRQVFFKLFIHINSISYFASSGTVYVTLPFTSIDTSPVGIADFFPIQNNFTPFGNSTTAANQQVYNVKCRLTGATYSNQLIFSIPPLAPTAGTTNAVTALGNFMNNSSNGSFAITGSFYTTV